MNDTDESRAMPMTIVGLARLALWLALVTWLGELAVTTFRKYVLGTVRVWNVEALLLGPVAYLLLFGVAPGGLVFAGVLARRRLPARFALTVLLAIGFLSFLLNLPLHRAAAVLAAVGLAVQSGRMLAGHPAGFERWVSRSLGGLATVVTVMALAAAVWGPLAERRSLARIPSAPAGSPNVLLLILDTVRDLNLSVYGYERNTTPQLERFAARAVRFERAIATAPWTLPSHVGFFTGRFPHEMRPTWDQDFENLLPDGMPFLAEVVRDRGYATAAFVANLAFATSEFGLDRGFNRYEDWPVTPGQLLLSFAPGRVFANNGRWRRLIGFHDMLNRKTAATINDGFLDWLSGIGDRPFLAFLNYFEAHEPYIPRPPFDTAFGARRPDYLLHYTPSGVGRDNITHLSAAEIEPQRNGYDASIAYLDHHLGQLLDELERRGVLDNTIVIITSDHGEMFGEHGIMGHVGRTYLTVLEVPLLVSFPAGGVPAGRTLNGAVSLRDLPATVMDLLGASEASPFPGRSLRRYWESAGEPAEPEPLLSEGNPDLGRKSLVLGRYHLVHRPQASDTTPELYDSETDPLEQNNLVGDPAHAAVLQRMRFLLDSMMARGIERNAMH